MENKLHKKVEYPLARLQGIVDAGATFHLRKSVIEGQLWGELQSRTGVRHADAEGPDLATVAAKLVWLWGNIFPRSLQPAGHNEPTLALRPGDLGPVLNPLRPHMRAALGELGALHGRRRARGDQITDYRTEGCECDYCAAFEFSNRRALAELHLSGEEPKP